MAWSAYHAAWRITIITRQDSNCFRYQNMKHENVQSYFWNRGLSVQKSSYEKIKKTASETSSPGIGLWVLFHSATI